MLLRLFVGLLTSCGYLNESDSPVSGNISSTVSNLDSLPLSFEVNRGQADRSVHYLTRGPGFALFLTDSEAVMTLSGNGGPSLPDILRLSLVNASTNPSIEGRRQLPGKSNYFLGDDPARWKTDVPNYAQVVYKSVYPGVDQVFYGNGKQLEYDFVVEPGADYRQIGISFEGTEQMEIGSSGELVLTVAGKRVIQEKPFVYQEIAGTRSEIAADYAIREATPEGPRKTVGFEIGDYDPTKPLIIDPVLVFSTYHGGSNSDSGRAIAFDPDGNVYVTGSTTSTNFPVANPLQPNFAGGSGDVFVTKINSTGTAYIFSTYFGGSVGDLGHGIDIDSERNVYVTGVTGGTTGSNNFPTTPGAFDRVFVSPDEAFLFKLNSTGNAVIYSTYTGAMLGNEVKVDKVTGEAYITGLAGSTLPATPGAFRTACPFPCSTQSFVTKFNAAGSGLVYSTYIGQGGATDLAIDAGGNAYITGSTISTAYPITPGVVQPTCTGCSLGRSDAVVTKLNATGSALIYSTYLGGSLSEVGSSIALDAAGNAYVTGRTESSNGASVPFPTTLGAFQTVSQGTPDGFVTKLNPTASALVYSTFLGGNVRDEAFAIATGPTGNAHVIGQTRSTNWPLVAPFQSACAHNGDCVFISSLDPSGSSLILSTYFGQGEGFEIAADDSGHIYVTGTAYEGLANLPTMNPIQPNHGSGNSALDGFIAKIQLGTGGATPTPTPTASPSPSPSPTPTPTPTPPSTITVVVGTSTDGLSFSVDGTTYASAQTFTWTSGSFHTIATTTPQQLGNSRYDWNSWSDGGGISHSVMPTSNTTFTAFFTETSVVQTASVSGRVFAPNGQGLRNAVVTMTDSHGVTRTTTTSAFGLYTFDQVPMGGTYTLRVSSKRYRFSPRSVTVSDNLSNLDFFGSE